MHVLSLLHNGARVRVLVAEEAQHLLVGSVRARQGLRHVLHVARRSLLVVGLSHVRIGDEVVRHVWPELGLLARAPHLLQHLARFDVAAHRDPALLPVYLHRPRAYPDEQHKNPFQIIPRKIELRGLGMTVMQRNKGSKVFAASDVRSNWIWGGSDSCIFYSTPDDMELHARAPTIHIFSDIFPEEEEKQNQKQPMMPLSAFFFPKAHLRSICLISLKSWLLGFIPFLVETSDSGTLLCMIPKFESEERTNEQLLLKILLLQHTTQ